MMDRDQVANVLSDLGGWLETFEGEPLAFDSDSPEDGEARYETFHDALDEAIALLRNN